MKAKKHQSLIITLLIIFLSISCLALEFVRRKFLGAGCVFKSIFGIACPTCGMTRAHISLLRLDIGSAFYYHPAWWTAGLAILSACLLAADKNNKRKKLWLALFILDIAVLIGAWIYRLATQTTV